MEELIHFFKTKDIRSLFITPTQNSVVQFFRYIFVGGIATVIDWFLLFTLTDIVGINYLISAGIGFIGGLISNYILSKRFVFSTYRLNMSKTAEFSIYLMIGVVGLGITELILFILTARLSTYYMISKAIATVIVLLWNYLARKHILYN